MKIPMETHINHFLHGSRHSGSRAMPELTYFCGNVATSSFFFCPEVKVETYSDWNFYGRGVLWWLTLYLIMLCSFIIWLFWTQIKSHITWRASRVLKDETKALPTGEYLGLEHQNLASGKSMIYWRWTLVFASFLLPVFAVAPFALVHWEYLSTQIWLSIYLVGNLFCNLVVGYKVLSHFSWDCVRKFLHSSAHEHRDYDSATWVEDALLWLLAMDERDFVEWEDKSAMRGHFILFDVYEQERKTIDFFFGCCLRFVCLFLVCIVTSLRYIVTYFIVTVTSEVVRITSRVITCMLSTVSAGMLDLRGPFACAIALSKLLRDAFEISRKKYDFNFF